MKKISYLFIIIVVSQMSGMAVFSRATISEIPLTPIHSNDTITVKTGDITDTVETDKLDTPSYMNKNADFTVETNLTSGPPPTPILFEEFSNPQIWHQRQVELAEMTQHIQEHGIGSSGYVLKIEPINLGTPTGMPPSTTMNLRVGTYISVVKGKTYSVRFKAAADSARTIDVLCTQKFAPFDTALWIREIPLDTTLKMYGSYLLNWGQNAIQKSAKSMKLNSANTTSVSDESPTDSMAFEFAVGASLIPVYLDDIEIVETAASEIHIMQDSINITDNSGIYDFGDVEVGISKSVIFTIENTGTASLNLSEGTPKVTVQSDDGFTLKTDAVSPIDKENSTTFEIMFEPINIGEANGTISIENNDASENPYNFSISGKGVVSTAINEIISDKNSEITVYPNPADNVLNIGIQALQGEHIVVEIVDIQGHSVLSKNEIVFNNGVHKIELNLKSMVNGTYFIKIVVNNKLRNSSKIVIQK